jgi:CRP-like cAMP-binding protein
MVSQHIQTLLRKLPLFADVADADLATLAEQCLIYQMPKESTIFEQGDPCDRVWIVGDGRVKIVYQDVDGREVILEMIEPGEMFGGAVLFFPRHPATARTAEDSTLYSLSSEAYTRLISTHPEVALKLLRIFGQRHLSFMKTRTLIGERVERRMAHILLKLADRAGRPAAEGTLVTIPLSRQDLADMSGTTLETAIRTLSRFARDGLIRTERGGYLVILDRQKLSALAQPGED